VLLQSPLISRRNREHCSVHRGSGVQETPILLHFFIPAIGSSANPALCALMIPLGRDQIPPLYQIDAIRWLGRFRHTEMLQQMLWRFHFSETEIAAYRSCWSGWLKAKNALSVPRSGNG